MSLISFSSSVRCSRESFFSISATFFAASSASERDEPFSSRPCATFSSSFSFSVLPPVKASLSPPLIAFSLSRASAIFFIVSEIFSPFFSISSEDLFILKVIVFHVFTQNPQRDLFSSSSSRMFLLISAISASIWWIACAFIASLKRSCASAASDMEFAVLSMAIPRFPYRPWSWFVSFSASSISAFESFSFSASCWRRSMRS